MSVNLGLDDLTVPLRVVRFGLLAVLVRPEHVGGDARHQAPWHNSLRLRAQIVAESRNYIAFAGGQSLQAGPGNLLRGLLVLAGELLLAGDGVEFRFGGTGTKGTDTNAVRPHLFGKSFRKQEVEGFRCGVGGEHPLDGGVDEDHLDRRLLDRGPHERPRAPFVL